MAQKQTQSLERIDANSRFADASAVLRTLGDGLAQIEAAADVVRIEGYLADKPSDARAQILRDRLARHRGTAKPQEHPSAVSADVPATVREALELLRGGARHARRIDRKARLLQLADDREVIREAIIVQQGIVDGIRSELSERVARSVAAEDRALALEEYRCAQKLAAAAAARLKLRSSIVAGGYIWRTDLMVPGPLRASLILGSESDFDSNISLTRLLLEQWKIL
ncbi:MAG: hypothetical protein WB823_10955 [Steroidobacteraceae bacterium]